MNIRKALPEDEADVIVLIKKLLSREIEAGMETAFSRVYKQIMEFPETGSVFVAEEDGEILGIITLSFIVAMRCGGIYSSIEEFIVDERCRGKGVGGKLLKASVAESADRNCYEIHVNNPSESGYPLYMNNGWEDLGRHLKMKLKY